MPYRQSEFNKYAWAIIRNARLVQDSIGVYGAIGKHAAAINKTQHKNFFGIIQMNALDQAVLGVARIYDRQPNKKYVKSTIYQLHAEFFRRYKTLKPSSYSHNSADFLGISHDLANKALYRKGAVKKASLLEIWEHLDSLVSQYKRSPNLEKILDYRDKFIAHQEKMSRAHAKMHRGLPSQDEFNELAKFAITYAEFVNGMGSRVSIAPTVSKGRAAALNVIKKILDIEFDIYSNEGHAAWRKFYE